jgi:hypothetical protein
MALYAHIAFAQSESGELIAAQELFQLTPAGFTCVACKNPVELRFARKGQPFFSHTDGKDCPLGAHHAIRAAAIQLLERTRSIQTPSLKHLARQTPRAKKTDIPAVSEEWDTGIPNAVVDGLTVDFIAETLAGRLGIQVSLPGLTDPGRRERLRGLGFPVLEVALAKPTAIQSFADLRAAVIESVDNKRWLSHPALEPELTPLERQLGWEAEPVPLEGSPAFRARTSVALTPAQRKGAADIAECAIFRQLPVTRKIESLERRIGAPQAKWPDVVDITVKGDKSFGVDHQLWQADTFDKFVRNAGLRHQSRTFSSAQVLHWLSQRYELQPPFPNAEKVSIYYYLEALASKGFLRVIKGQIYHVISAASTRRGATPQWVPFARLSVSTLVSASKDCGLRFPLEEVERMLESFDEGHPAEDVDTFVATLAFKLRAPPRSVLDFLRRARLILTENESQPSSDTGPRQAQML